MCLQSRTEGVWEAGTDVRRSSFGGPYVGDKKIQNLVILGIHTFRRLGLSMTRPGGTRVNLGSKPEVRSES